MYVLNCIWMKGFIWAIWCQLLLLSIVFMRLAACGYNSFFSCCIILLSRNILLLYLFYCQPTFGFFFFFFWFLQRGLGFPGSVVKKPPAMQEPQETRVQSLGWENPLEKGMATHFSIPAWRILWTEEPVGLQSTGSQWVGYDCNNLACMHTQRGLLCTF